ncbi:MAG TPA: hypothetical protein VIQ74_12880 [Gemmatimonadaceae bacterium]
MNENTRRRVGGRAHHFPRAGDSGRFPILMSWFSLGTTLAIRAIVRPSLAVDLLRVAWRFRRRGWYRQAPFLPIPAHEYTRWRMYTAYGDADAIPPAEDVIRYARWVGSGR